MNSQRAPILLACALFAAQFAAAAHADDCKLGRIASLDFTDNGAIIVPVSIEGTSMPMAIDTGSEGSAVDPVVASNLHLAERRVLQDTMYDAEGEQFTYLAVLHTLGIGDMHANEVRVLVWPSPMSRDGRVAGVIAADLLRHFDVDIDFGAHKLNLFSQDHCPGRVVYWAKDNVAIVPMHVVNSGHIIVPITLDNHPIDAVLDTGSSYSVLSMEVAKSAFGLSPASPDMARIGDISGAVQTAVYRHTFKTLGLEGLTIANPALLMRDNLVKYSLTQGPHTGSRLSDVTESDGVTDITLGLNELRHLHLYIAYKEQKLYITPASPQIANSAPAATPATTAATH